MSLEKLSGIVCISIALILAFNNNALAFLFIGLGLSILSWD